MTPGVSTQALMHEAVGFALSIAASTTLVLASDFRCAAVLREQTLSGLPSRVVKKSNRSRMDITFCNGSRLLFGCEGSAPEGLEYDKSVHIRHRHSAPTGVHHHSIKTTLDNVDLSQLAKMIERGIRQGRGQR